MDGLFLYSTGRATLQLLVAWPVPLSHMGQVTISCLDLGRSNFASASIISYVRRDIATQCLLTVVHEEHVREQYPTIFLNSTSARLAAVNDSSPHRRCVQVYHNVLGNERENLPLLWAGFYLASSEPLPERKMERRKGRPHVKVRR